MDLPPVPLPAVKSPPCRAVAEARKFLFKSEYRGGCPPCQAVVMMPSVDGQAGRQCRSAARQGALTWIMNCGMTRWKPQPLYPKPISPVQRALRRGGTESTVAWCGVAAQRPRCRLAHAAAGGCVSKSGCGMLCPAAPEVLRRLGHLVCRAGRGHAGASCMEAARRAHGCANLLAAPSRTSVRARAGQQDCQRGAPP